MNFEFSDEQQQLHDTVNRYLSDQNPFEKFRAINASAAGWDKAAWAGLANLGVLALNVPAAQGRQITHGSGLLQVNQHIRNAMLQRLKAAYGHAELLS